MFRVCTILASRSALEAIASNAYCSQAGPDPEKNNGCCDDRRGGSGGTNPINLGNGNKYQLENDYAFGGIGGLRFIRTYNSTRPYFDNNLINSAPNALPLGTRWRHSFDMFVDYRTVAGRSTATVRRPDGRSFFFNLNTTNNTWVPEADVADRLTRLVDGQSNPIGWQYTTGKDVVEVYDVNGKLQSITERSGLVHALSYSDAATPPSIAPGPGLLIRVAAVLGQQLNFTYDASNRIATMTDPAAGLYQFTYDTNNNLTGIVYPDTKSRGYVYNEQQYTNNASLPNALTGIVDENAGRYAIFRYDTQGRATSSEHAGGVDKVTLTYVSANARTTTTDALGTVRTYNFDTSLGVIRNTDASQPCDSCGSAASVLTYDANNNVSSRTDFNSNKVCYSYDYESANGATAQTP